MASGHVYRVGHDWFVDTAVLQRAARRHVVEPMMGAYQILAPAGLVRCAPALGLALPGQTGDLFRCQGQRASHDIGPRLRDLAADLGLSISGEWNAWPVTAHADADHACGCTACKAGGACSTDASAASIAASLAERLIASETLGTVGTRAAADAFIAIHPAKQAAPEWACGRYHECIGQFLRFPDIDAANQLARVHFQGRRTEIVWELILDRQRRLMLQEILELVGRQLVKVDRSGSVRPSPPPITTPGFGTWEMAAHLAVNEGPCTLCPYQLGTNLRCPACRSWLLAYGRAPASIQALALTKILGEHQGLRELPSVTLRALGHALADSHAKNPHEPLTDRFFVRLERDVLVAAGSLNLGEQVTQSLIETAELTPLDREVTVGAATKRAP